MTPIVLRDGIPCKLVKDGWKVTVWESRTYDTKLPCEAAEGGFIDLSVLRGPVGGWVGSGQREVRISRRVLTVPIANDDQRQHLAAWCGNDESRLGIDLRDLEERAERSRKKSGQRAKRNCRHKIKHGGFRHMLTGTYRDNMTDFDKARADFAAWIRKVKKVHPGFRGVWAFEPQDRGAWHWHCSVDTLPRFLRHNGVWKPSYEVCTLLWREVVGDVAIPGPLRPGEARGMLSGGTVNVDGHVRKQKKKLHADARGISLAKIASYVSKYLTKDYGDGLRGRQMWGSSENLTPPKGITYEFPEGPIAEVIAMAFECPPGHRVARHWLNSFGDCWVLDTEPIPI